MTSLDPQESRLYASVYSPSFLSIFYDVCVLNFNMRYVWRCRTDTILLPFFSENFSRRHLDCGCATGYFPAKALARPFRSRSEQQLAFLDLNPNPLVAAKKRALASATNTTVDCFVADVTAPVPKALQEVRFDSISMFNLFHCIPGKTTKLQAFSTFKDLLSDSGVLAGCTVLGEKHATNWFNRLYVRLYNRIGLFHNLDDQVQDFQKALDENFEEVETWVIGMTLLFRATKPRRGQVE